MGTARWRKIAIVNNVTIDQLVGGAQLYGYQTARSKTTITNSTLTTLTIATSVRDTMVTGTPNHDLDDALSVSLFAGNDTLTLQNVTVSGGRDRDTLINGGDDMDTYNDLGGNNLGRSGIEGIES